MKRILGLSVILIVSMSAASAQSFKAFGLKLGVNYGESVIKETFSANGADWTYASEEADVGISYGMFGRVRFKSLFFQPELLATNHQTKMKLSSITYDSILNLKQNRFDIPLLIGYSRKDRVRGYLGPVYTKMTEDPVFSEDFFRSEIREIFSGGTWAFQIGFGFDMAFLTIDARYETNLGQFQDNVNLLGQSFDFDHRSNTVQVTIGWDFVR